MDAKQVLEKIANTKLLNVPRNSSSACVSWARKKGFKSCIIEKNNVQSSCTGLEIQRF
jgi:hypothetical protein